VAVSFFEIGMKKISVIAVFIWIGMIFLIAFARFSEDPTKRTKQVFPVVVLLGIVGAVISLSDSTKVKGEARAKLAIDTLERKGPQGLKVNDKKPS
jgi:hypothetical protein